MKKILLKNKKIFILVIIAIAIIAVGTGFKNKLYSLKGSIGAGAVCQEDVGSLQAINEYRENLNVLYLGISADIKQKIYDLNSNDLQSAQANHLKAIKQRDAAANNLSITGEPIDTIDLSKANQYVEGAERYVQSILNEIFDLRQKLKSLPAEQERKRIEADDAEAILRGKARRNECFDSLIKPIDDKCPEGSVKRETEVTDPFYGKSWVEMNCEAQCAEGFTSSWNDAAKRNDCVPYDWQLQP